MEDFVTYEQAIKLKELGFDWECNHYYNVDHVLCENINNIFSNYIGNTYYQDHNNDNDWPTICSAPTLTQAQKWLREVKGISVEPFSSIVDKNWAYRLYYSTKDKFGLPIVVDKKCMKEYGFNTYEAALLAGIDKALELLKLENNGK